jgi:hypothetical protein
MTTRKLIAQSKGLSAGSIGAALLAASARLALVGGVAVFLFIVLINEVVTALVYALAAALALLFGSCPG